MGQTPTIRRLVELVGVCGGCIRVGENGVRCLEQTLWSSLSEEKHQAGVVAEEHRRWQRQVQEEGQQLREGRMKVLARCEELQQRVRQAEEEREAVERKLTKEVSLLVYIKGVRGDDWVCGGGCVELCM